MKQPVLVLALAAAVLFAPGRAAAQPAGDDLQVFVLTFGPGDHPFFKFGHNAIWVRPAQGNGLVFNYGTFTFDSPMLIPQFLKGRLQYWLSVAPDREALMAYEAENRSIEAQELDLTPAQRWELLARLRENARPAKREYLYDYFWDNCSTRVRDMVDGIVEGRVRAAGDRPGGMTFRAHALRMTADLLPEYLGLYLGLGSLTDKPITLWQEAFLPERLRDLLRTVRIPAGNGGGQGGEKPLVKSGRVLFAASRPPPAARPPAWLWAFSAVGAALGVVLVMLGQFGRSVRGARVALGVLVALLGLVLGFLGLALVLLWALTNHRAAWANENILQCAPFALALSVWGAQVARDNARGIRRAGKLALAAAALSGVGLLLKVAPGFRQDNFCVIALLLPLWAGMATGLARLRCFR